MLNHACLEKLNAIFGDKMPKRIQQPIKPTTSDDSSVAYRSIALKAIQTVDEHETRLREAKELIDMQSELIRRLSEARPAESEEQKKAILRLAELEKTLSSLENQRDGQVPETKKRKKIVKKNNTIEVSQKEGTKKKGKIPQGWRF